MPDLLVAKSDGSLLHSRPVGPRSTLVIGRAPNCQVVVPSERASRHHAVVFEFNGDWFAVDLDSTAGLEIEQGPLRIHRFTAESPWARMGPVVLWIDRSRDRGVSPPRRPLPIKRREEPVVRNRADLVDPGAPPPPSDGASLLVAFRRKQDGAIRLLDLAEADRLIIGGDPACDILIPGDQTPMRALFCRVGSKWVAVDLGRTEAGGNQFGHQRLAEGTCWDLGTVEAIPLTPEFAIPRGEETSEPSGLEDLDVPDLGSIFATRPEETGGDSPVRPANR
jgi:hypothetical protein